jgi:cyanophycinase
MSENKPNGSLMIIGGGEDKKGDQIILKEVARHVGDDTLVIIPTASSKPEEMVADYTKVFQKLGVKQIEVVDPRIREDGKNPDNIAKMKKASAVFMTGGDQLSLTSIIGDTPIFQEMLTLYKERGGLIVGTSAGAAAMSEVMLVAGGTAESVTLDGMHMAPGFKLLPGVVLDSHFAERGRISRLLGAISQNPKNLGIGIDENTAIYTNGNQSFRVLGEHSVYVVDGKDVSYSSLPDQALEDPITMFNVRLHVLADGYGFDIQAREPIMPE